MAGGGVATGDFGGLVRDNADAAGQGEVGDGFVCGEGAEGKVGLLVFEEAVGLGIGAFELEDVAGGGGDAALIEVGEE